MDRIEKVEGSLEKIAGSSQAQTAAMAEILIEQGSARKCRSATRDSILDLKDTVLELKAEVVSSHEKAVKERDAMSTQLTIRAKPITIVRGVTAAVMAALAFYATKAPEAAAVITATSDAVSKVIQ